DGGIGLAGRDGLEDIGHRIDRYRQDVLARLEAGLLHRLDRADHHVVVVGVDRANRLAAAFGLDEAFHHLLALGAGEVAVWLRTTLRLAFLATTLSKPFLRLVATLAPTVPCSSTTLQALPATVFASHSPATAPSCTLSEVTAVR